MIIRDNKANKALRSINKNAGPQSRNLTIRIDNKTLEEFKAVCGETPYQTKIKEVMREYIYRKKQVFKDEEERNLKMQQSE